LETTAIEGDSITLLWQLYDRNLAKVISQGKSMEKGRDSLTAIISRVSEKIKISLPNEGKVLRVKKEGVLVSLGKRDGLKKSGTVVFQKKDKILGEAVILELGKEMSLVQPKFRDWEKEIATGEMCFIPPKAEAKEANPAK
jgi:rRNA processing protein Gar1